MTLFKHMIQISFFVLLAVSAAFAEQINLSSGDRVTIGSTLVSCNGGSSGAECKNFGGNIYCGYGCKNFGGNIYCAETPGGECQNFGGNIYCGEGCKNFGGTVYCANGGLASPAKPSHP